MKKKCYCYYYVHKIKCLSCSFVQPLWPHYLRWVYVTSAELKDHMRHTMHSFLSDQHHAPLPLWLAEERLAPV